MVIKINNKCYKTKTKQFDVRTHSGKFAMEATSQESAKELARWAGAFCKYHRHAAVAINEDGMSCRMDSFASFAALGKAVDKFVVSIRRSYPLRDDEEISRLLECGWHPFPDLNEADNDIVFQARLKGFASCFPCVPSADDQAQNTLAAAKKFLEAK